MKTMLILFIGILLGLAQFAYADEFFFVGSPLVSPNASPQQRPVFHVKKNCFFTSKTDITKS